MILTYPLPLNLSRASLYPRKRAQRAHLFANLFLSFLPYTVHPVREFMRLFHLVAHPNDRFAGGGFGDAEGNQGFG
jgi:hypothetical protein